MMITDTLGKGVLSIYIMKNRIRWIGIMNMGTTRLGIIAIGITRIGTTRIGIIRIG